MNYKNEDTESLINKIALDDNNAFRIFYDLYYLKIYKYASFLTKSSLLIEEIVSDTFCSIWLSRKKNPQIINFEGYLYTITKNRAIYYLKKENATIVDDLDEYLLPDLLIHDITPENMIIDKEISIALKEAIDELPEKCRQIFLMVREERLKYKEIADILSISEKTVNAQMVLAIKKLTKRLGNITYFLF